MSLRKSISRRQVLISSTAATIFIAGSAVAKSISGAMPWQGGIASPVSPLNPNGWLTFSPKEVAIVEAIVDRLIPADESGPGGKDSGCALFIDRQLAGPYGGAETMYMRPPFMTGVPGQGTQTQFSPKQQYRLGLSALDDYCIRTLGSKGFASLSPADQDKVLRDMEAGKIKFEGISAKDFFHLILTNTQEGFFADPIYGGNKDMAGWKLIGFAGARYDYRDYIDQHNKPFPLPPVSLQGRAEWNR
ncbi:gluconate 2-dehydrogenase subunit 3 family protein [Microvirga sp. W0021]|uniref:Gluconate 2-dehydrogenase subunit 3 family protein n=1 Tax=Hohaiivirga grylli TaxID=3133970 RepID=A0ABV0BK26_9HYPH